MMIVTVLIAVALALPGLGTVVMFALWYVLPGLLVTVSWPVAAEHQVFARASLASYLAITMSPDFSRSFFQILSRPLFELATVLLAGWISVRISRRLGNSSAPPIPPPFDTSARSPVGNARQ